MNLGKILQLTILVISVEFSVTLISYKSLINAINSHLFYLSYTAPITLDATLALALGSSETLLLIIAAKSATDIPMEVFAENTLKRLKVHIDYEKTTNPSDFNNVFLSPENWLFPGDFTFRSGQVSATMSTKTTAEIYADTILNDPACFTQLYANPAIKSQKATCNLQPDCVAKMTSTAAGGPVSADNRIKFLTEMAILNCEETPAEADFYQIVPAVCSLILAEVLKINSDTPFPPNTPTTLKLYLQKLILCGAYGYPEFYPEEAVKKIMELRKINGSTGTGTEAEMEKTTAEALTLMISYLRMRVEGN